VDLLSPQNAHPQSVAWSPLSIAVARKVRRTAPELASGDESDNCKGNRGLGLVLLVCGWECWWTFSGCLCTGEQLMTLRNGDNLRIGVFVSGNGTVTPFGVAGF